MKIAGMQSSLQLLVALMCRALAAAGNALLAIIIVREFGLDVLGEFTVLTALGTLTTVITKAGYDTPFLRENSRLYANNLVQLSRLLFEEVRLRVFRRTLIGVAGFALVISLFNKATENFDYSSIFLIALTVIALAQLALVTELFKSWGRADLAISVAPGMIALLAAVVIALVSATDSRIPLPDVPAVVMVHSAACIAIATIAFIVAGEPLLPRRNVRLGNLRSDAARVILAVENSKRDFLWVQIYTYASMHGLFVVAAFLFSNSEIGIVRLAERIATPTLIIMSIVNPLIASRLSTYYGNADIASLRTLVRKSSTACVVLAALVSGLILGLIGRLVPAIGVTTEQMMPLVAVLCIGNAANLALGPVTVVLSMTNRERDLKRNQRDSMFLALIGVVSLSLWLGVLGFCIAFTLSSLYRSLVLYLSYRRLITDESSIKS